MSMFLHVLLVAATFTCPSGLRDDGEATSKHSLMEGLHETSMRDFEKAFETIDAAVDTKGRFIRQKHQSGHICCCRADRKTRPCKITADEEEQYILFKGGQLGFTFGQGGVVKAVDPHMEAAKKGVQVGWVITRIADVAMVDSSVAVLQGVFDRMRATGFAYSVTFKKDKGTFVDNSGNLQTFRQQVAVGESYCCKSQTKNWNSGGCDRLYGYTTKVSVLNTILEPGTKRNTEDCSVIEVPPAQLEPEKKIGGKARRVSAFSCGPEVNTSYERCKVAEQPYAPDESGDYYNAAPDEVTWKKKPLICRGTHKLLGMLGHIAPTLLDIGQSTGIAKASLGVHADISGVKAADMVKNVSDSIGADLIGEIMKPVAMGGGMFGAFVNTLKIINGVCTSGWDFIGSCPFFQSLISIVLATTSLVLAFTGLGAPLGGLLMGVTSFLVRRVMAVFCQGCKQWFCADSFYQLGKIAWEALVSLKKSVVAGVQALGAAGKALLDFFVNMTPEKMMKMAKDAAKNAVKFFWKLLTGIPKQLLKTTKWALDQISGRAQKRTLEEEREAIKAARDQNEAAERALKREAACCAMKRAKATFEEGLNAEMGIGGLIAKDAEVGQTEQERRDPDQDASNWVKFEEEADSNIDSIQMPDPSTVQPMTLHAAPNWATVGNTAADQDQ